MRVSPKKMRVHRGFKKRDLSSKTGIDVARIKEIERNPSICKVGEAFSICKALNCSIDDLDFD